jgi:hypothetical protein
MCLSPYLDPSLIFLSPPLRLSSIVLVLYPLSSSFLPPFLSTPLFFCPLLFPIPLQVASAKISQGTGTACVSWGATFSLPLPRDLGPKTGTDSVQISSSCSSYYVLSCLVVSCLVLSCPVFPCIICMFFLAVFSKLITCRVRVSAALTLTPLTTHTAIDPHGLSPHPFSHSLLCQI